MDCFWWYQHVYFQGELLGKLVEALFHQCCQTQPKFEPFQGLPGECAELLSGLSALHQGSKPLVFIEVPIQDTELMLE